MARGPGGGTWSTPEAPRPVYFMWLQWQDGLVSHIHDRRYARYVMDGAEGDFVGSPRRTSEV
ncbi:hypothetical protein WDZ92_33345 [Nostoc sp. NIES-2111]